MIAMILAILALKTFASHVATLAIHVVTLADDLDGALTHRQTASALMVYLLQYLNRSFAS